jgi:type IVB pilus formation R64 PilN family outer membrane protein
MWLAYVTRTFQVAFMPGASDYLMGKSSSTSSSSTSSQGGTNVQNFTTGDNSEQEYSSFKGTLSVWKDLEDTIKQLISPDGKVVVSQATTSITVRDKPTNVDLVGQYIANMNSSMSRQVLVKVQVLQVDLTNDFNWGINWAMIANAFKNSPFVLNANYGTPLAIQSFTPQGAVQGAASTAPNFGIQWNGSGIPGYTILFNALNQQGKTSVVTEPRIVCLNNQVSVIRITQTKGYVQSVQNTTLSSSSTQNVGIGTVTSQITPGSIVTGLTLYILPKIMKEKIYLQVNADLSILTDIATFGPANSTTDTTQVQLPTVASKSFNQRSVIRSGDTLILSGFREVANRARAQQFITSQALGGRAGQEINSETVVLITPYVLNGSV